MTPSTRRKQPTCHKSLTNFITLCCIRVHLVMNRLAVIGTDCKGSCKSNYHTITTTTAPLIIYWYILILYFNGSVISWKSALFVEETENHEPAVWHCRYIAKSICIKVIVTDWDRGVQARWTTEPVQIVRRDHTGEGVYLAWTRDRSR
jgi:hypothetical protein